MAANRKRISRTFYSIYAETRDGDIFKAYGRREDAEKALRLVNRQNGLDLRIDDLGRILLVEREIELPARVFEMYGTTVRSNVNLIYERKENER